MAHDICEMTKSTIPFDERRQKIWRHITTGHEQGAKV